MINVSRISNKGVIGRILRFPLKFIPPHAVMPVLQGGLRGKKWIVGSGIHGYWLGSYEYDTQRLFTKTIKEGAVVYDIGAHAGFYTLLASRLVGSKGRVFAFEPLPKNLKYLKRHLRINRCNNVHVIGAAVVDKSGSYPLKKGDDNSTGKLSPRGHLRVRTVCLDELISKKGFHPPQYLKIDVEGAELLVLRGAKKMLMKYHPSIFLSTHNTAIHKECCRFLELLGYRLQFIDEENIKSGACSLLAVKK